MPLVTLAKIKKYFKNKIKGKKLLLMGVSYKEDVADTRLSPSEIFYKEATKLGAKIFVHDQMVKYWSQLGIKVMQKIPKIIKK